MEICYQRYNYIKNMVENCQYFFNTNDPIQICKLLDIKIYIIPLRDKFGWTSDNKQQYNSSDTDSRSFIRPIHASIYLSNKLNFFTQRIVCAHELGHIFLHKKDQLNLFNSSEDLKNMSEYEANLFAIELMPYL